MSRHSCDERVGEHVDRAAAARAALEAAGAEGAVSPENPQNSGVDLGWRGASGRNLDAVTVTTRQLLDAGVAEATSRARQSDVKDWMAFVANSMQPAAPVKATAIADYAALLLTVRSPSAPRPTPLAVGTVERRLASVSSWSVESGYGHVDLSQARLVIRGFRRTNGAPRPLRAAPIGVDTIRLMLEQLDVDEAAGLVARATRDRALLTTAYCLAARRSEVVALRIEGVSFVEQGALIRVLRRKTREVPDELAVPFALDPKLCAVRAIENLLALLGADLTEGPLFRRVTRTGVFLEDALRPESVADIVARVTRDAAIELPPGFRGFSGHSLRRGAVSAMREAGADAFAIAKAGGWSSNSRVLGVYLDDSDRWRSSPLRAFCSTSSGTGS